MQPVNALDIAALTMEVGIIHHVMGPLNVLGDLAEAKSHQGNDIRAVANMSMLKEFSKF